MVKVRRQAAASRSALCSALIWVAVLIVSTGACGGEVQPGELGEVVQAGGSSAIKGAGGMGTLASGTIASVGGTQGNTYTGGAGGAPASTGFNWGGFGGLPFSGYCAGTTPKVYAFGQYLSPQVAYDTAYGLDFKTSAWLGFDLHVDIAVPGTGVPTGVCYTNNSACPQANVSRTDESPTVATPTVGTIRKDPDPTGARAFVFGVCVEVDDPTSNLFGSRIFSPSPNADRYR